jgi:hypothetical protein
MGCRASVCVAVMVEDKAEVIRRAKWMRLRIVNLESRKARRPTPTMAMQVATHGLVRHVRLERSVT